ncbi:MAG TPA: ParB/RepB/Spo0J family partition protein [Ignavibacteriales bacterium]|nr:ParB/RepB/Spo0J family partition protein [Ignavibacteriales bacterium]HOL80862.1 ParB/RepB/Spo0J family partition protein [Ignavibacteriales bacterium]HOM65888.1 ParB/RepB/Spo0J family partition protein [Ignavibacteriales bacterium]HPD67644.1 ParB/RepB/Spo0J family partition protein [Ignavibacteriales bacterium]HPP33297.1 ParB/RepB/Spo0J family partition protein [Ignavibacteriales bacterium]
MKTTGLGKGLDAIFTTDINNLQENLQVEIDTNTITKIDVNLIDPNPFQPRVEFDREALDELKKSILQNGLIQPITVRPYQNRYQLISGERRLRSFKELGYKEIPAYIINVESDEMMLALALIENLQREKLNIIEVAHAYQRLIDECNLTQEQVAEKVGKERSTITNTIRLLKLPKAIQDSLAKEEITPGHARALLSLENTAQQLDVFEKIKTEQLSVRKVEQLVQSISKSGGSKKIKQGKSNSTNIPKDINIKDYEDKLRHLVGTKVSINHRKDGDGEIIISYFSLDEFERIFELLNEISNI